MVQPNIALLYPSCEGEVLCTLPKQKTFIPERTACYGFTRKTENCPSIPQTPENYAASLHLLLRVLLTELPAYRTSATKPHGYAMLMLNQSPLPSAGMRLTIRFFREYLKERMPDLKPEDFLRIFTRWGLLPGFPVGWGGQNAKPVFLLSVRPFSQMKLMTGEACAWSMDIDVDGNSEARAQKHEITPGSPENYYADSGTWSWVYADFLAGWGEPSTSRRRKTIKTKMITKEDIIKALSSVISFTEVKAGFYNENHKVTRFRSKPAGFITARQPDSVYWFPFIPKSGDSSEPDDSSRRLWVTLGAEKLLVREPIILSPSYRAFRELLNSGTIEHLVISAGDSPDYDRNRDRNRDREEDDFNVQYQNKDTAERIRRALSLALDNLIQDLPRSIRALSFLFFNRLREAGVPPEVALMVIRQGKSVFSHSFWLTTSINADWSRLGSSKQKTLKRLRLRSSYDTTLLAYPNLVSLLREDKIREALLDSCLAAYPSAQQEGALFERTSRLVKTMQRIDSALHDNTIFTAFPSRIEWCVYHKEKQEWHPVRYEEENNAWRSAITGECTLAPSWSGNILLSDETGNFPNLEEHRLLPQEETVRELLSVIPDPCEPILALRNWVAPTISARKQIPEKERREALKQLTASLLKTLLHSGFGVRMVRKHSDRFSRVVSVNPSCKHTMNLFPHGPVDRDPLEQDVKDLLRYFRLWPMTDYANKLARYREEQPQIWTRHVREDENEHLDSFLRLAKLNVFEDLPENLSPG